MQPSYQERCWQDGITCRSCVGRAARSVATVCSGLTAEQAGQTFRKEQAGQTFRKMYSDADCLLNEHDFQWAYLEADWQVLPMLSKKIVALVQIQAA